MKIIWFVWDLKGPCSVPVGGLIVHSQVTRLMVAGLARCKHNQVRERNRVLGLTHATHG